MTVRQELREQVIARSGGRCEWQDCVLAGAELAHLHSVGSGGRPSADTLDNVCWLCRPHARMSDGERVAGWDFDAEHARLGVVPGPGLAWRRAEALRNQLRLS